VASADAFAKNFVGTGLVLILLSCGASEVIEKPQDSERVSFREVLGGRRASADLLVDLARRLPARTGTSIGTGGETVLDLAFALIDQGRTTEIGGLFRSLDGVRRDALAEALRKNSGSRGVRTLLRELSTAFPTRLDIAGFREDGPNYLMTLAEDVHGGTYGRGESLLMLREHGGLDLLPRLKKLTGDATEIDVPLSRSIIGDPANTIGKLARETAEYIAERVAAERSK
jgi:hypothetical protein